MLSLIPILSLLATICYPVAAAPATDASPPPAGIELTYNRPLGQVARYRMSLDARGEQRSLGERLPVRWKAQFELVEEVVAKGTDGALWLRVRARLLDATDSAGTLAGGMPDRWPAVQVRLTPRGELIDVSPAIGEPDPGPRERGLASLMMQPGAIVLPAGRVQVGDEWTYESAGIRQASRLLSIAAPGGDEVARIASTGSSPLALDEASPALGLTTRLTGRVQQESRFDLLVASGLVARHTGEMRLETRSEAALDLPDGPAPFEMETDLRVAFDVQLLAIDGQSVERH
jgi:hypothetical protein